MPQIPGYRILDEIGRGARGTVYRARRGDQTYAIKIQDNPEDRTLLYFGASLACIHHPGLPEIKEVGEAGGRPYLVREYVPGYTLAAELEAGPMEEERIVEIGKTLAGTLDKVHRHGLLHRDVKPANILISREGRIHLIDFGFATQIHNSKHSTVGTYLYSAPEQMKALHAPVDQRSDLYALGGVLYACATGEPPYSSEDSAELSRLHASAPVPRVVDKNINISPALSQIIEKCLAKDPGDRYPTGASLLADLQAIRRWNSKMESGEEVALGESHRELLLETPPLIGRDSELMELETCLVEVMRGRGRTVSVLGEGGSGKSLLLQSFLARAERARPLILKARGEKDQPPYSFLHDWIGNYLSYLESLPAEQREFVKQRVVSENSNSGQLLCRMLPEARELFGPEPSQLETEELDSFLEAASSFFSGIARLHGVLILVLEDSHNLSNGDRKMLRRMQASCESSPLLLLITSREEQESSVVVRLEPLERSEVEVLVFSMLGSRPVSAELVTQIEVRSRGNPFSATEYLRSMLQSGVVLPNLDGWQLDSRGLQSLQLPANVLELVLKRLAELAPEVHSLLSIAAVYGLRFRVDVLQTFVPCDSKEIERRLESAVKAHILEQESTGFYTFVHISLRDALLCEQEKEWVRRTHLQIATGLKSLLDSRPELQYVIARHYSLADEDSVDTYRSNLCAGQMALREFAFEDAYEYLSVARRHAEGEEWLEPLSFSCERTGRTEEGIELLDRLLEQAQDSVWRAELLIRHSHLCLSKLERAQAREDCVRALEVIGERIGPKSTFKSMLRATTGLAAWLVPELIKTIPTKQSGKPRRDLIISKLYQELSQIEFLEMNYARMFDMAARACQAARKLGPSPQLLVCYANYLIPIGMSGNSKLVNSWFQRLITISDEVQEPFSRNHLEVFHKMALLMAGGDLEDQRQLEKVLRERHHVMESWVYLVGLVVLVWVLLMKGEVEQAWSWVQRGIDRCRLSSSPKGVARDLDVLACYAASCLTILGRPGEAAEYLERAKKQVESGKIELSLIANYNAHRLLFYRESGELGAEAAAAEEDFLALGIKPSLAPLYRRHFYVAGVYRWLDRCHHSQGAAEDLQGLDRAITLLEETSKHPILKTHLLHAKAVRHVYSGRLQEALKGLAEAQRKADLISMPWVTFEVARSRARVFRKLRKEEIALRDARWAYEIAKQHSWSSRARAVAAEFSFQRSLRSVSSSRSVSYQGVSESGFEDGRLRLKRQLEALLNLSLASVKAHGPMEQARVALDELIGLLRAERAYLFLASEDKLEYYLGRNQQGEELAVPSGYSRTVIEAVDLTRETMVLSGTEEGVMLGAESVLAHDLRSIICAPLAIRDQFVGVVYLDNRLARGVFNSEDIEIVKALSSHIAVALETARVSKLELEVLAERRRRELAVTLQEFTASLAATHQSDSILSHLRDTLSRSVPWQRAGFWLYHQPDQLELRLCHGFSGAAETGKRVTLSPESPLARALLSGKPFWANSLKKEPELEYTSVDGAFQWVAIPLLCDAKPMGVVTLSAAGSASHSEDDIDMAVAFCNQAAVALDNANMFQEIRRLAITDSLTGLNNRRHFFDLATQLLSREATIGMMMMDVDHFKSFNDTYGHAAGDEVLKHVATVLKELAPPDGIVARLGGEEFVLLHADDSTGKLEALAEAVRNRLEQSSIRYEAQELRVTMSLGLAFRRTQETVEPLLNRADELLYRAKESGRNRVVSE